MTTVLSDPHSGTFWAIPSQYAYHQSMHRAAVKNYRQACSDRAVAYGKLIGAQIRGDEEAEAEAWKLREAAIDLQDFWFAQMNYHDSEIVRYRQLMEG